ncbi:High-affnity carbon uptake protein Hat/HatR [Enhygromyxa salina]|uniref:High-affnity carbon uptake protein Hat/HatR n=1 Tax=Enhygromyxa salina TaxID=215803 RepID=A0A0C1ZF54_9BACT|nr:serine/threonine-protein kinase [Enhygromyxa salina]KIG16264.1 High-affnity carbon uptake protein Hat/HatR [Enhygromyxa salina]
MEGQTQAEVERAKLAKERLFGGDGADQLRKQMIKARFLQSLSPPPGPNNGPKTGGDETRDQREGATEPSNDGLTIELAHIDRFAVLRKLGEGGMGVVYAAFDEQLNRRVAIKLLRTDLSKDERGRARMQREAQALARLSHPNVVQVHEIGRWREHDYVAMEYVEGQTLLRWREAQERTWREVLDVMIQAGRGLAAAHAAGLVHRDFKPANLLVGNDGRPRVLDFGLARAATPATSEGRSEDPSSPRVEVGELFETGEHGEGLHSETGGFTHDSGSSSSNSNSAFDQLLTATGSVLGTPAYMAPEQHLGERATELSDQFSFCLVLYEALFGDRPYKARSRHEYSVRVRDGDFTVPGPNSGVPGWLRHAVCRGLAPQPANRWASMDALLAELGRDRARAWKRTTLAAGLMASVGVAVALGRFGPSAPVCEYDRSVVDDSWSDTQRASMRAAFSATELDGATQVFEHTARALDSYADALVAARTDACEQRRVHQAQTDQQLELRMSCLEQREGELAAVAELFAAADQGVVLHASELVAGLGDIDMCAAVELLERHTPVPKDQVTAAAIAQVRRDIASAQASAQAGKILASNELVASIEQRAADLNYGPLLAEVAFSRGFMFMVARELTAARGAFVEAMYLAEISNFDELRWRSAIVIAQLSEHEDPSSSLAFALARAAVGSLGDRPVDRYGLGFAQARALDAHGRHELALAEFDEVVALARDGFAGSQHKLVWALKARAAVAASIGRGEQARADLADALQLREQLGADDIAILHATRDLAILELEQSDYAGAKNHFNEVLAGYARVYGPESANVGHAHLGLAEVALARDHYEEAEQLIGDALKIFDATHPDHAWALDALAGVQLRRGAFSSAVDSLERALAHSEAVSPGDAADLGYRHGRLGDAFAQLGQHERALAEFDLAIELLDGEPPNIDQTTPLIGLGMLRLELGQPELARASFERAVDVSSAADHPMLAAQARLGLAQASGVLGDHDRRVALAVEAERLLLDLPDAVALRERAKELQGT